MCKFMLPMVQTIWKEEKTIKSWNTGHITSIWKGKGDCEMLKNHRGITTSSAIGTTIDSMLDSRIGSNVTFTQAQGGGKKGASTCDHLFILRAIIEIAKKEKRETYITFYDVSKAYDNANNDDMLTIIWEKGLRGKSWRILKNLNSELKAMVKTRFGSTEEFNMEIGGKQGSRLTGRLFSKMMDMLAEELQQTRDGFRLSEELIIAVLLWVDDVVSCAVGTEEQEKILNKMNEFAIKHKLQWGQSKCAVMRVGKHIQKEQEWKIGDLKIQENDSYTYLGDTLTSDGKNAKNIEKRKGKITASTVTITTIASNEILNSIETAVLIELHEKINISTLLTNSESWTLNKGEIEELERIETQAIKNLFNLPVHIPTPALIFAFGTLYTGFRIQTKQLTYIHKVLNRENSHWTKHTLKILETMNIGWAKTIKAILNSLNLPTDFQTIQSMSRNEWKQKVREEIEKANTERLKKDCHNNETQQPKTKTASIVPLINHRDYRRGTLKELVECTKNETKTVMLARYGMLACGNNFKGTMDAKCNQCNVTDNEDHRLNYCYKYKDLNEYYAVEKTDFQQIYSNDIGTLRAIIQKIDKVWDTKMAHGSIKPIQTTE